MNPLVIPPAIVGGALLVICIALFWLWVSQRQSKKRIRRLEQR